MGTRITQASFTRGELTPKLDARVDTKYHGIGLKSAKNALIHQEGGISNRHGLEYCGVAKYIDRTTRLMKFVFNQEQTYMLEFGDKYIRVLKDGGYVIYPDNYGVDEGIETVYEDVYSDFMRVYSSLTPLYKMSILEDPNAENSNLISVYFPLDQDMTTLDPTQLIGYNAYTNSSCTELYGEVDSVDTDNTTIKITKEYHNEDADKVALQGEIVEIETPYSADDVMNIKKSQAGDILTLTHPDYPAMNLSRLSHYDWELEEVILTSVIDKPTNVTATFSSTTPESNTKTYEYCVTAVDEKTNTESERSDVASVVAHREANWTTSESITIRCDEILGASEYNIYRNVNGIFGYVGTAQAQENAVIVKNNVKFSGKTTLKNQTTGMTVIRIKLSGGTYVYTKKLAKGNLFYSDESLKTYYGTCTALTNTSSTKRITLCKRGMKFVDTNIEPDLSSSAPVVRNPFEDDNYPSCSAYFQQRKVYANSKDYPQTLWASQTGTVNNFNVSRPLIATDAITLAMDDREMNEIRHLVPMKDLLVFTSNSEFKVNGTDGIFQASPMPAAVIQSCYGSSDIEPIISGDMVIFVQAGGSVIRDLGYDIMTEGYNGDELSLLSSHLFEGKKIISMAYAKEPYRIVYVVFDDGTCAAMTYNKKQEICGWSRLVTDGKFKCVDVVREGLEDVAYFVIDREIGYNIKDNWKNSSLNAELSSYSWRSLVYGNNIFIALDYNGYISTSTDGITWTEAQNNLDYHNWVGITFDGEKFAALSKYGYISTSTDGTTWTRTCNNLGQYDWISITYGNGKFLALVTAKYFSTSTDCETWTTVTSSNNLGSHSYVDVAYGNGKFVALGSSGYISTSIDATDWTQAVQNSELGSNNWKSIFFDGTRFIALSSTGYVSTSTDGTTWTTAVQNTNLGNNSWRGLTFGNNKFVAIGNTGYVSTLSNKVKYVERTRKRIIDNAKDAFLVDCGLAQQFDEPKTTLPGLDWLEGKEIVVNADGGIIDNLTVVNGQVTLPREVTNVIVGLPYEFEIETLNFEGENTQGLKKVINHVSAKVYKTREDFEFVGADNVGYVNQRCYESILDSTKLFSKDIASTVISDAVTDATVKLRQKLPLPITVLSISAVVDVQDNENA